jgi:HEAT repeat protein
MGEKAIPTLAGLLQTDSNFARIFAISVLRSMKPISTRTVPLLCPLLKDQSADVRVSVAWALGSLGAMANEAVSQLLEALAAERELEGQVAMILALGEIGQGAQMAAPVLEGFLSSQEEALRRAAISALSSMNASSARGGSNPR